MGISRAQASKDINSYINDHPENIAYDSSTKAYVLGPNFKERYITLDSFTYLNDLLSITNEVPNRNSDWIVYQPEILKSSVPIRGLDALTLRNVLFACEQHKELQISYQSMSSPDPEDRVIVPHALAHDGFRWHARALCSKDQVFKDFVLGRILKSALGEQSDVDASTDEDWHQTITLKIAPHPGLSENQRRIVELDYAMNDGAAELSVRKCLLFYNLKRLGLDVDTSIRAPQDQHIVLINDGEVRAALERGRR
ncbi:MULTISPECIES: WYL domain-containing protein [Halocynthiibacter]|uniref:WYL domain-containing protein n=1 Tax=Halocynthiibacter halioticoli TaxID=2986804 RepID=A0AAE3J031_9RHOB|nr:MULTISPECIES: WYL domain-containing protein [Halocynthiibacter]MCV6824869.1 WYL domain-containing protein [Halocynthiibacter halioticoli]MCW4057870.1 WYL domain-containing protein [Halocynthiibacter sp. SDUM655004]